MWAVFAKSMKLYPHSRPEFARRLASPRGKVRRSKRVIDLTVAVIALALLGPLMLVIALLVRLMTGVPVLFRQERPGLRGKPFVMYKFRTMNSERDASGNLLPDDQRLTRLGKLLRKTSLDELPELFNVLEGDMSLVGPRPLLMEYLPLYTPWQSRRHDVKPGITGWAQLNGRNGIPISKRLELDVWYVDHWSLWLDIKILIITIPRVILARGVKLSENDEEVVDIGVRSSRVMPSG